MVCFSSPRLLPCPEPLKSSPFPHCFSVYKALYVSFLPSSSQIIIFLFFIFLFKTLLFSPSATISSTILLPLGFLLSLLSYAFHLFFRRPFIPVFACQNCVSSSFRGKEVGRLGGFFCYERTPRNAPLNTWKPCRGELAQVLQHFQLMAVWLMPENQQLILTWCCSFPPPTSPGLAQQAFIFTLETLLHALKPLEPCGDSSLYEPQDTEQVTDTVSDTTRCFYLWLDLCLYQRRGILLTENHVQGYPGRFQKSSESSLAGSRHT